METVVMGNADGVSNGTMKVDMLLNQEQLNGKCGLYAHCALSQGATLNFHEHHGESETYFILSGQGSYDDNGETTIPVAQGDVLFCTDGKGHAITNNGASELVFMALIINA